LCFIKKLYILLFDDITLALVFTALYNEYRRLILEKLFNDELDNPTLSGIAAALGISPQETRRHLLLLQDAKLIHREGNRYKLTFFGWVTTQFMVRLEMLSKVVSDTQNAFITLPCMTKDKESNGHMPCMGGKFCPLIYSTDVNYGIFKLLNCINSIITQDTGYIAGILTVEDILDYVINQLEASESVNNGHTQVLIVAPFDLITNPQDYTHRYGILILQCETDVIRKAIGMDLLFNAVSGLAIPHINGTVNPSIFFTLKDDITIRHLVKIWNWFVKNYLNQTPYLF